MTTRWSQTAGTAASQTLPPYSITTLQLYPAGGKEGSSATATPGGRLTKSGTGSPTTSGAPKTGGAAAASEANAVAGDAQADRASIGPLALTGAGSVVAYGMAGSVLALVAGSVLMVRRRKAGATHRR